MRSILLFGIALMLSAAFISCSKNEPLEEVAAMPEVTELVKLRVISLGFSAEDIIATEGGFIVEGDIFLSNEEITASWITDWQTLQVGENEQFRTTNLVTSLPRNITVFLKTSGNRSLPASYGAALDIALARYNAENLRVTFTRVYSASAGNIDITRASGNYLASAGFPTSSGNPYGSVEVNSTAIGTGTSSTFNNYLATILAHEIGHCIGFRHTDYMDRSYSCGGSYYNEGASTVGAINIPGTPTTADPNSWMLSCIGSNQNRPFNNNDKTALSYLY
ncbi:MAG: protease [Lewinellaceae bacterium]|nr:protease [Lewinellaceae bacterium]